MGKICPLFKEKIQMSKLGRYSADRKKIETLNSDVTLKEADCGTIFGLLSGSSAFTVTLPPLADAGRGWWCKFVYIDTMDNGANATISRHSDDASEGISVQRVASSGSALGSGADAHSGINGDIRDAASVEFSGEHTATNDTLELWAWVPKSSDDAADRKGWYGTAVLSSSLSLT